MATITYNRDSANDTQLNKLFIPLMCWAPTSNGSYISSNVPADCVYTKDTIPTNNSDIYTYTGSVSSTKSFYGFYGSGYDDIIGVVTNS